VVEEEGQQANNGASVPHMERKVVNRFGSYPVKPVNHRVLALIGKTY